MFTENNPHPPIERIGIRIDLAKRAFDQAQSNASNYMGYFTQTEIVRTGAITNGSATVTI